MLAYAHGEPVMRAKIRSQPEDFFVEEIDSFPASGSGEHLLLSIEKREKNTAEVAQKIARWAGVADSAVSYAGLKDRNAVTRQRFSVWLPKKTAPDLTGLAQEGVRLLAGHWHSRKLPRGALAGNRFVLCLREVAGEREAIEARLAAIASMGVPNYFGEQRFGCDGENLEKARAMFAGRRVKRELRSILLSAARSEIFNQILAVRVQAGNWNQALEGEVFMLAGSQSIFGPEPLDEAIQTRLAAFDIHPTGALWGRGELRSQQSLAALETRIAAQHPDLCAGLEQAGLKQERRSLRLMPENFTWQWLAPDVLQFAFQLPPGSYATTVLRELFGTSPA